MRYTYVKYDEVGENFIAQKKNIAYYTEGELIGSAFFHAIKHANARDWWFIRAKLNSNTKLIFGIDETGIFLGDSIAIGDSVDRNTSGGHQARFSPLGDTYATHSYKFGLNLYDFDRTTGLISNHRSFFIKPPEFQVSSLEFSPSGQFAYVIFVNEVYQVDLWADDPESTITLVGTYDGFAEPFATLFRTAQLGPDCKIYIGCPSTVPYLHVINNPDERGLDCDFVQRGIELPQRNSLSSLPNNPQFRIDEEDICDPTITNVFGLPVITHRNVSIWPNPASHTISTDGLSGTVRIYDQIGQMVLKDQDPSSISVERLPDGMYIIQDNQGNTGRFVVQRE